MQLMLQLFDAPLITVECDLLIPDSRLGTRTHRLSVQLHRPSPLQLLLSFLLLQVVLQGVLIFRVELSLFDSLDSCLMLVERSISVKGITVTSCSGAVQPHSLSCKMFPSLI